MLCRPCLQPPRQTPSLKRAVVQIKHLDNLVSRCSSHGLVERVGTVQRAHRTADATEHAPSPRRQAFFGHYATRCCLTKGALEIARARVSQVVKVNGGIAVQGALCRKEAHLQRLPLPVYWWREQRPRLEVVLPPVAAHGAVVVANQAHVHVRGMRAVANAEDLFHGRASRRPLQARIVPVIQHGDGHPLIQVLGLWRRGVLARQ